MIQLFQIFDSKDACVTPVLELDEVDQHPHNASRNSFTRKDNIVSPVPAPKLSVTPGIIHKNQKISVCGQHTTKILESNGYSHAQIIEFLKNNIIFEESKSKI